ncbi:hypothetical protein FOE78_14670 [Microlunatus elymi]|uniref:Uncharacterized protein n=1 Tax=Microlunatus elymi TaxID=2596828 RepID=A0A516Q0R7_9ACTN|nr:hypothetical protein [Microlunatus elymi]QDP96998.1 hypothetical protein FOE78_14670 [Microlunatus elymi]
MGSGSELQLQEWLDQLPPRLDGLSDFVLPADVGLDFSPESLPRVEQALLIDPALADSADPIAGYLGETLMRIAGGGWRWDDVAGRPVVITDQALGLAPISPYELIMNALDRKSGTVFADTAAELERAVADRRAHDRKWQPEKEHTSGVDRSAPTAHIDPWLSDWLEVRRRSHPAWTAQFGAADAWDFSVASLDRLEQQLLARFGSVEDLLDPANSELAEGACWYLGEVAVRHRDAAWVHHPEEPDAPAEQTAAQNPWIGRPYVKQNHGDLHAEIPIGLIRAVVRAREPGTLQRRFGSFEP